MPRTRDENARDEMQEQEIRTTRVPLYVIVNGEPTDEEDRDVPGVYRVAVDSDLSEEEMAETALDLFHEKNGISCLDDFEIRVVNAAGKELERTDNHESGSLLDRGEYLSHMNLTDLPKEVLESNVPYDTKSQSLSITENRAEAPRFSHGEVSAAVLPLSLRLIYAT